MKDDFRHFSVKFKRNLHDVLGRKQSFDTFVFECSTFFCHFLLLLSNIFILKVEMKVVMKTKIIFDTLVSRKRHDI